MYKPFLEIKDGQIIENYTTSTASKNLSDLVYKSIRVFALSKHSKVEITREKLSFMLNELLDNKDVAVEFANRRYNLKDIIYCYIKEHGNISINSNIDMELLNKFYDNELKELIRLGCSNSTIAEVLNHYITLTTVPEYLLLNVIDKEGAKKIGFAIGFEMNAILQQFMEQIKEERLNVNE